MALARFRRGARDTSPPPRGLPRRRLPSLRRPFRSQRFATPASTPPLTRRSLDLSRYVPRRKADPAGQATDSPGAATTRRSLDLERPAAAARRASRRLSLDVQSSTKRPSESPVDVLSQRISLDAPRPYERARPAPVTELYALTESQSKCQALVRLAVPKPGWRRSCPGSPVGLRHDHSTPPASSESAQWDAQSSPDALFPPDLSGWVMVKGAVVRKPLFLVLAGNTLKASHRDNSSASTSSGSGDLAMSIVWDIPLEDAFITPRLNSCTLTLGSRHLTSSVSLCFEGPEQLTPWTKALHRAINSNRFSQFYRSHEFIAEGQTSSVQVVSNRTDNEIRVARIVHLDSAVPRKSSPTFDTLRRINHPSLVSVVDVFQTPSKVHVVSELMSNRDTLENILDRLGMLSERATRLIMRDLVSALGYLHCHRLVHRNINPRNVFCLGADEGEQEWPAVATGYTGAKLSEPSVANFVGEEQSAKIFIQSVLKAPHYVAPEVARGEHYGPPTDIWSCGVVMYQCLTGCRPFGDQSHSTSDILREVDACDLTFEAGGHRWKYITEDAHNLVVAMLQEDPLLRPTAEELIEHPWMQP